MNLAALASFIAKSGLRKVGAGLYMFTVLCFLIYNKVLGEAVFAEIATMLILAVFAGNALEHFVKAKDVKEEKKQDAPPAP